MVTLVFVDRTRQTVNIETAWELCRDPTVAGRIIDALTLDKELQRSLRDCIDSV